MAEDLDAMVAKLQARVDSDAELRFGAAVLERWKKPRHFGVLPPPCVSATAEDGRGRNLTLYLALENGRIALARFTGQGCGPSMVCGEVAAELALGRTPQEAARIGAEDILAVLGGLPEDKRHYAEMGAEALRRAAQACLGPAA